MEPGYKYTVAWLLSLPLQMVRVSKFRSWVPLGQDWGYGAGTGEWQAFRGSSVFLMCLKMAWRTFTALGVWRKGLQGCRENIHRMDFAMWWWRMPFLHPSSSGVRCISVGNGWMRARIPDSQPVSQGARHPSRQSHMCNNSNCHLMSTYCVLDSVPGHEHIFFLIFTT